MRDLEREAMNLANIDTRQNIELKKTYAKWMLIGMGAQLLVANVIFVAYAWVGVGWEVRPSVMHSWLGATVIQLVGVVYVITRYLFPNRDESGS